MPLLLGRFHTKILSYQWLKLESKLTVHFYCNLSGTSLFNPWIHSLGIHCKAISLTQNVKPAFPILAYASTKHSESANLHESYFESTFWETLFIISFPTYPENSNKICLLIILLCCYMLYCPTNAAQNLYPYDRDNYYIVFVCSFVCSFISGPTNPEITIKILAYVLL